MKTKHLYFLSAVVLLVVGALFAGGYSVLNSFFPMARPIGCPAAEAVTAASVSLSGDAEIPMDNDSLEELLPLLCQAKPTRRPTVNDTPSVTPWYRISLLTSEREYRYFIYEEDGKVYIELPYDGVYRSDRALLPLVMSYCEE